MKEALIKFFQKPSNPIVILVSLFVFLQGAQLLLLMKMQPEPQPSPTYTCKVMVHDRHSSSEAGYVHYKNKSWCQLYNLIGRMIFPIIIFAGITAVFSVILKIKSEGLAYFKTKEGRILLLFIALSLYTLIEVLVVLFVMAKEAGGIIPLIEEFSKQSW